MDTSKLRKFAQFARRTLIEQVGNKLEQVIAEGSLARRENEKAVANLDKLIEEIGEERVIEQVAYTWFNRFVALRYMDINRYTRIGIVSPPKDQIQPEILGEAKMGHIDEELVPEKKRQRISEILDGTITSPDAEGEAYRLLLVAACNYYHRLLPFMFESIADYTELLLPNDLLSGNSILTYTRETLIPANCSPEFTDQSVEVIGWLYQFYISEKKDDVFAALKKGKKITPENIPAATQLFTPHWIVRYLVENSLGRLWMLNHPNSRLFQNMKDQGEDCYYIEPEEPETDFLKIKSPEEIKVCDPACGSGHMLTYAFDLLYSIYKEEGYDEPEIPGLILKHNLYGVEIDNRAGSLAAFALTMKALEKDRRFFSREPIGDDLASQIEGRKAKIQNPNICVLENVPIDPEELSAYMEQVGHDLFSDGLQGVVNQWKEADNFGSLIRPMVTDVTEALELLRERQVSENLFLKETNKKVLKALRQADYLSPKYHVVVANPPYLSRKGMNEALREFAKTAYPNTNSDMFAMFMERNLEMLHERGLAGFMTPLVWMFISSHAKLRKFILEKKSVQSLVHPEYHSFFDSAYVPICGFILRNYKSPLAGHYFDLRSFYGADLQPLKFMEALNSESCEYRYQATTDELKSVPGYPVAYWASAKVREAFSHEKIDDTFDVREGLGTRDDDIFLRRFWEVALDQIRFSDEAKKWVKTDKAGGFKKWAVNGSFIMNWENDGYAIKNHRNPDGSLKSRPQNTQFFFREAVSWGKVGSGTTSFRYRDATWAFNDAAPSLFGPHLKFAIGLLNSKVLGRLIELQGATLNVTTGIIGSLPYIQDGDQAIVEITVERLIELTETDWDSFETSWSFQNSPLLSQHSGLLIDAYQVWREKSSASIEQVQELEQRLNEIFVNSYGLDNELTAEVPLNEISLEVNPRYRYDEDKSELELEELLLADTMREFISYAVGCMLGRYSLDQPGLILANQDETADDYRQQIPEPTFAPDEDNVIPILDGDWFEDDMAERFKTFLRVTFGEENYEENLTFLEDALYPKNKEGGKRKTIRHYFLKDFYNHHVKLYKKRPIYWLFSSPKGVFNALIYMHRYREDTVSIVLNDYLREYMAKMTAQIESQQRLADNADASTAQRNAADKKVTKLKKAFKELEEYESEILRPLADEQVEIDLDDGVKVNYNKFGKALKKITGLTGKA